MQEPSQAFGEEDHLQVFGEGDGDRGEEVSSTVSQLPTTVWFGYCCSNFSTWSSPSHTGEGSNIYWG